jgi:hypothetical protein
MQRIKRGKQNIRAIKLLRRKEFGTLVSHIGHKELLTEIKKEDIQRKVTTTYCAFSRRAKPKI